MLSIGHTTVALDPMRSENAAPAGDDAPHLADRVVHAWTAVRDAVLRGLVHALSNRVGTVSAAAAMLEAGSADVARRVLAGESERLERLLEEFRLLTADPFDVAAGAEPLVVADVMRDALSLRAHAVDGPEPPVTLVGVDQVPPVLVSRAGLLHALLVLLHGVGEDGIAVHASVDAGAVVLGAEPTTTGWADVAAWLLAGSGVQRASDGTLRLPRLSA